MSIVDFSDVITFSRASAATYFDSEGVLRTALAGVPRIDYGPITGECRGLLVEGQRKNAVLNGVAQCAGTSTSASAGTSVGPDGQLATKVIPAAGPVSYAGSGNPNVQTFANNTTAGQTTDYSFSGYFAGFGPKNYQPYIVIYARSNSGDESYAIVRFDTATGLFSGRQTGTGFSSLYAPKAVMMPTGMWYVTWTVRYTQQTVLHTMVHNYIQIHNESGLSIYTADGVSGIQRACLQFEEGSFPTSYIPTTTSQVTRAADVARVNNLSPWFNAEEGTWKVRAQGIVGSPLLTAGGSIITADSAGVKDYTLTYSSNPGAEFMQIGQGHIQKIEYYPKGNVGGGNA